MRRILAGLLLLCAPTVVLGFDAVDALPYPSTGIFPAYPSEGTYPRSLYIDAGMMHDTNVLRTAGDGPDETIWRGAAGVRAEQRIYSRQVLRLEARGEAYIFNRFAELDHLAYGLGAEWVWALGSPLTGTLGYTRRRFLVDLGERQSAVRDLVVQDRVYGSGAFRLSPDWRVRAGFDHTASDRPEAVVAETAATSVTAGMDYVTPRGNAIGVEVRSSEGDASIPEEIDPLGLFVDNDFKEREVAAVATYTPGPQLRLGARLGRTKRTYSEIPGRDFEGTTGRVDAEWRPGNKTILAFEAYRVPRSIIDIAASHVLVSGFAFGPSWAPTAKLVFSARLVKENREYSGDPAAALGVATLREEVVHTWRLGAGWEATRRLRLGLAIESGERTSNLVGRDYDYTSVMANFRYSF
jgi:hypothetical protein